MVVKKRRLKQRRAFESPTVRHLARVHLAELAPRSTASAVRLRAVLTNFSKATQVWPYLFSDLRAHGLSLANGRSPLTDGVPWITFEAKRQIEAFMSSRVKSVVVEFGSGGSTLWFLRNNCRVISIEHDEAWFEVVAKECPVQVEPLQHLDLELRLVPGTEQCGTALQSVNWTSDERFRHLDFRDYVHAASDLPRHSVDIVFIDGRARSEVLRRNFDLCKPDGMLILDNSERSEYWDAMSELASLGWEWTHYYGPIPYLTYFTRTSVARPPGSQANSYRH